MKLLFFDIDGVLNSGEYGRKLGREMHVDGYGGLPDIDPKAMEQLNRITDETDCKLVISSGWRYFQGLFEHLKACGLKSDIFTVTPILYSRGHEIKKCLHMVSEETGEPIEAYAVLDDNDLMCGLHNGHFIQTEFEYGLTKEKADEIVKILKK